MRRAGLVLGGGRSTRMGTDKLALVLEGRPLLTRSVDAALTWASRVVVAGDPPHGWSSDPRVRFRRESPAFGGPVAGIAAALPLLEDADEVLILAGDLADPLSVVRLLAAEPEGEDGIALEDTSGWPQYLAGRYRLGSLRDALSLLEDPRDVSVRRLMRPLTVRLIPAPVTATQDLDTPEVAKIVGARPPHSR